MDKITHEMRIANWTKLIQECLSSGLSKKEWCLQNHVDEKLYYYWQRKVREETYENQVISKPVNHEVGLVEAFFPNIKQPPVFDILIIPYNSKVLL